MRRYRALGVAVVALLVGLVGCHHTIYTTVSPNQLTGGSAKVGDDLVWSTLTPGGPGYTVKFLYGVYPCGSNIPTIPVPAGTVRGCKVLPPAQPQGPYMAYFYSIIWDNPVDSPGGKPSKGKSKGTIEYSVIPCKGCAAVMAWNGPSLTSNTPGDAANGSTAAAPKVAGVVTDAQATPATIQCPSGQPATVTDPGVSANGAITWYELLGFGWNVDFGASSPCTNGTSKFSSGGPTVCTIVANPSSPSYKYSVTVTGDGAACTPGPGTLTIK
jgi:hypothetical protein